MAGRDVSKSDRRFDERHEGEGLFMLFEDHLVEVVDISVGGLKFKRPPFEVKIGHRFSFELRSAYEDPNPLAKGIAVARAVGGDWVAIEFVRPTFSLMKVVGRHIGRLLLGRSHLFRH